MTPISIPTDQIGPPAAAHTTPARWPLVWAMLLLWAGIAALTVASMGKSGGQLVYALDDPYIHMAMAKNLAAHGVWGVTPYEFTSSSSSLAWTALLGGTFAVFGAHDAIPFLLNVLLASGMLVFARWLLVTRCPGAPAWAHFVVLVVLTFATPLPTLVFAGQEHILHVLATTAFVFAAADVISSAAVSVRDRSFLLLAGLALALPLVRYEGLYAVLVAAALLLIRRRLVHAAVLIGAAGAPVFLYGAISTSKGWFWAPNSVVLKGNLPDWSTVQGLLNTMGYAGYSTLLSLPAVAFLVYAAIVLFALRIGRGRWDVVPVLLALFTGIALLHLQYSQPRAFWLFRYEAYVVALGILVVARAMFDSDIAEGTFQRPIAAHLRRAALLVLLLVSPLSERAVRGAARVPEAVANIYEQQYQMGRFVREYYDGAAVALNDIGVPSYRADIHLVDLVGLASIDVARMRRAGLSSPRDIADLVEAHGVDIAIVYDRWFQGQLPAGWARAGSWKIHNPVVVGSDTVSFYAVRPSEYPALVSRLQAFGASLPPGVTASIGPISR